MLFTASYLLGKEIAVKYYTSLKYRENSSSKNYESSNDPLVNGHTQNVCSSINTKINRLIFGTAVIGSIGSILLAIDLLFLRGIDYTQGISAARDLMNQANLERGGLPAGRSLSIIGRILSGFLPVATLIAIFRSHMTTNLTSVLVFCMLFFQCTLETLSGGRNSIFIILVLLLMGSLVKASTSGRVTWEESNILRRLKPLLPWLSLAFFSYVTYVFIERESLRGRSLVESYENIQNSFLLNFDFNLATLANTADPLSGIHLALVYLSVYIVHGLNELNLLCSQLPEPNFWYGLHNFILPVLLFQKLGFISAELTLSITSSLERSGVYLTALGAIYLDFGYYLSFLLFAFWGLLSGIVWKSSKKSKGDLIFQLICSYLLLTIAISPFYLSISTANGFQILSALILTCVILHLKGLNTA